MSTIVEKKQKKYVDSLVVHFFILYFTKEPKKSTKSRAKSLQKITKSFDHDAPTYLEFVMYYYRINV